MKRPLVIAHRGASGYRPEHTLAAYRLAIEQGADYIEPDLVITQDGVLICRHENEISGTTDVAERPEFAHRKCTKRVDGLEVTGWFSEDFTLAEIKILRARERIPQFRPDNTRFDGQEEIPTFDEVLSLARTASRRIGVYPETKHPSYFASLNLSLEQPLLEMLRRHRYDDASAPVFIQSFEVGNLQRLSQLTRIPLIQLIESQGAPFDFVARGDPRQYQDLLHPQGLAEIARYAAGIGPHKLLVIPRDSSGRLTEPTSLVAEAHAAGLQVHAWTFRAENEFLPTPLRSFGGPAACGDLTAEIHAYLDVGVDGFFTDHPNQGVAALLRG